VEERRERKVPVGRLIVAALIWAPFIVGLFVAAHSAEQKANTRDWRQNHATKVELHREALVVGGVPTGAALLGAALSLLSPARRQTPERMADWAATGLLVGALGLAAYAVTLVFIALQNLRITF
jgi:hypothetical protein